MNTVKIEIFVLYPLQPNRTLTEVNIHEETVDENLCLLICCSQKPDRRDGATIYSGKEAHPSEYMKDQNSRPHYQFCVIQRIKIASTLVYMKHEYDHEHKQHGDVDVLCAGLEYAFAYGFFYGSQHVVVIFGM